MFITYKHTTFKRVTRTYLSRHKSSVDKGGKDIASTRKYQNNSVNNHFMESRAFLYLADRSCIDKHDLHRQKTLDLHKHTRISNSMRNQKLSQPWTQSMNVCSITSKE